MSAAKLTYRSWEFDPPAGAEPITTTEGGGRQITVEPKRLVVTRHERWGLHVQAEGRWILRDGSYGPYRKSAVWNEGDLADAPEWVRVAVTEVAR